MNISQSIFTDWQLMRDFHVDVPETITFQDNRYRNYRPENVTDFIRAHMTYANDLFTISVSTLITIDNPDSEYCGQQVIGSHLATLTHSTYDGVMARFHEWKNEYYPMYLANMAAIIPEIQHDLHTFASKGTDGYDELYNEYATEPRSILQRVYDRYSFVFSRGYNSFLVTFNMQRTARSHSVTVMTITGETHHE